ncbi:MAG: FixH family protein [Thiotrichales bacterium]|nr:FixH family protein [Thiotrichales bacterium]
MWMVFAIPATAVLAGAVMLILANATWDGLVADDYYRRGMEINRSLARDAEATRLGLEAVVSFPKPGVVETRLTTGADAAMAAGDRLDLRFAHAARAGADVIIPMIRDPAGAWRGTLPPLPPGKWYVELGNDRWRLTAPARMPAPRAGIVLHATEAEAPNDNSL